ncbi:hypothetical protein EDD29_3557 [Actinocorallia herbida]|uniref:Uncharacterized protein n=1 Tax=Actinocorallia herbida TaxID=58109 RepID=A0A3N1CXI1_9ACTN|nr:hypothetical protein [Actinocorallia herbida]ROO86000.1 hypothetical protein EDD29_3557 [Actinocorallia herbida]
MESGGVARRLAEFARVRLGGRPVPEDLRTVLTETWEGRPGLVEQLGVRILEPGTTHVLMDHSYLSAADRANPDLMANVAAMTETAEYLRFVVELAQDFLLGYWFHPAEPADRPAPIVLLDTEGTYEPMPGATLTEAVVSYWAGRDDGTYADYRAELAALGLSLSPRSLADLTEPTLALHPEAYQDARYAEAIARLRSGPTG